MKVVMKRMLVLVAFLLVFMSVSQNVSAEEVIADGSVKESYGTIMWSIDKNGHLRVSGTGDISNKTTEERAPWYKYRSVVTSAEISVSGMKDASYLFNGCENMTSINLADFETGKVTNMSYMFQNCKQLKSLDLSVFDTRKVEKMNYMFHGCMNLSELGIDGFSTSGVTEMIGLFCGCTSLKKLQIGNWNTENVKSMDYMFSCCTKLQELDIENWNTKNVKSMKCMFEYCGQSLELDFTKWDTNNVETMVQMFKGWRGEKLNLKGLDTGGVTSMSSMFAASSLKTIDLSVINTENVESMYGMFRGCSYLQELDISVLNTSNVNSISYMFRDCKNLVSLNMNNLDFRWVYKSGATDLLRNCENLQEIIVPRYLNCVVSLPVNYVTEKWCLPNGEETVDLPINLSSSVKIQRIDNGGFRDVYESQWYYDYVEYVRMNGLMSGYNRYFTPNASMTRAMVVQTLYNMEGKPEVDNYKACTELKDVYRDWYTDAVCWAYNTGITTGYDNTKTFEVNTPVTREQLATFLYRYVVWKNFDSSQSSDLSGLRNNHMVSSYAETAVRWAVGTGLIRGKEILDKGDFVALDLDPKGTATRAEMATILMRFYEEYKEHMILPVPTPDNKDIPEDAFEWQGSYYAIFDNCDTWEQAKEYCETRGGHLATINSPKENEVIYKFMIESGYTSAYFGLSDKAKEGAWTWINGETVRYTNWNEDEPGGGTDENYAMFFYLYEDGTWNDGAFKENVYDGGNAYICEWE